jgi:hypothetical protein
MSLLGIYCTITHFLLPLPKIDHYLQGKLLPVHPHVLENKTCLQNPPLPHPHP